MKNIKRDIWSLLINWADAMIKNNLVTYVDQGIMKTLKVFFKQCRIFKTQTNFKAVMETCRLWNKNWFASCIQLTNDSGNPILNVIGIEGNKAWIRLVLFHPGNKCWALLIRSVRLGSPQFSPHGAADATERKPA